MICFHKDNLVFVFDIQRKMFSCTFLTLSLVLLIMVNMLVPYFWTWLKRHSILLQKLACYGFSDSAHSWLRSFLHNRMQQVIFQGYLSSSGPIKVGVPQGSIRGSCFFLFM